MSRAADGTSAIQDLDFSSLRSQLGSLAAVSAEDGLFIPLFCPKLVNNVLLYPFRFFFALMLLQLLQGVPICPCSFWIRQCATIYLYLLCINSMHGISLLLIIFLLLFFQYFCSV